MQLLDRLASEESKVEHEFAHAVAEPLVQFSLVFSTLIHEIDHPGIPNSRLIEEAPELAKKYKFRSIAEQHSIAAAFDIFLSDSFVDLRNFMYKTRAEATSFRQLVVNSVMATDVLDKDMKELRNRRWEEAFAVTDSTDCDEKSGSQVDRDRKVTILLEHLMQASDIIHTMQHVSRVSARPPPLC